MRVLLSVRVRVRRWKGNDFMREVCAVRSTEVMCTGANTRSRGRGHVEELLPAG